MAETVRIDPATHTALTEIAKAKHIPLAEALRRSVELLRREVFFEQMNAGYLALRADPDAWAEEQRDVDEWDRTAANDGVDDE
jgi:hypothetical protein